MTCTIGTHYRPSDYRFARRRSDDLPLEPTPPLTSHARRLAAALLLTLGSFAVMAAISMLGGWLMG